MNKNKKIITIVIAVVAVILVACSCLMMCKSRHEQNGSNIAVVDIQHIVTNSTEIQQLKTEQDAEVEKLQKWLEDVKAEVEAEKSEIAKQSLVEKYNAEFVTKQQTIKDNYTKKLQDIDNKITKIIKDEAKKLGYDIVISKGVVIVGGHDITADVATKIK